MIDNSKRARTVLVSSAQPEKSRNELPSAELPRTCRDNKAAIELAGDDLKKRRSFTGDKLDWMNAVMADPRLNSRAFEVAFCIAQHVNQQTGRAILSDEVISDKTSIPERWIARARSLLRQTGWIDWMRSGRANRYWTLGANLNAVSDHLVKLKEGREERRRRAKSANCVPPRAAYLKTADLPPLAEHDLPPLAEHELPQVANIHLSRNTLIVTPSKNQTPIEEPLPKIDHPQLAEMRLIEELGEGDDERGVIISQVIGERRFRYLLNELRAGRLYPSAITAAVCSLHGAAA